MPIDITDEQLLYAAATLVATVALYARLRAPDRWFGPRAGAWNPVRRLLLPPLDRLKRERIPGGFAMYTLEREEYVGIVDADLDDVEYWLHDQGFERMPLAALKELEDGRLERGSWVLRDGLLAERQLHVMLFDAEREQPPDDAAVAAHAGDSEDTVGVDVYAHEEYNALHPVYGYKHYRGVDYDPEAGVRRMVVLLADHEDFVPSDIALDVVDETQLQPVG